MSSKLAEYRRAVAVPAFVLVACSEPDWTRVMGTVSIDPDRTVEVTVPAEVDAGEDFIVTVITIGSSNCTRADGNALDVANGLARFVPYDEVPSDDRACFRDAAPFPHTDVLRFGEPGLKILRVVGQFQLPDTVVLDSVDVEIEVRGSP
jgi:hypothetical protein